MTTLNTTDDLLRAARENREFREAFRREILTEDLMESPRELRELKAITGSLVEGIAALVQGMADYRSATDTKLERIDNSLGALVEKVDKNSADIVGLGQKVDKNSADIVGLGQKVDKNGEDINGLGDMFRAEVKAQSSYRGTYAVEAAREDEREVASLFAYKHGLRVIKTCQVPDDVLENWLADNFAMVESLDLRERAWRTFLGADIVVGLGTCRPVLIRLPPITSPLKPLTRWGRKTFARAQTMPESSGQSPEWIPMPQCQDCTWLTRWTPRRSAEFTRKPSRSLRPTTRRPCSGTGSVCRFEAG